MSYADLDPTTTQVTTNMRPAVRVEFSFRVWREGPRIIGRILLAMLTGERTLKVGVTGSTVTAVQGEK